jgi:hypothetical protein
MLSQGKLQKLSVDFRGFSENRSSKAAMGGGHTAPLITFL